MHLACIGQQGTGMEHRGLYKASAFSNFWKAQRSSLWTGWARSSGFGPRKPWFNSPFCHLLAASPVANRLSIQNLDPAEGVSRRHYRGLGPLSSLWLPSLGQPVSVKGTFNSASPFCPGLLCQSSWRLWGTQEHLCVTCTHPRDSGRGTLRTQLDDSGGFVAPCVCSSQAGTAAWGLGELSDTAGNLGGQERWGLSFLPPLGDSRSAIIWANQNGLEMLLGELIPKMYINNNTWMQHSASAIHAHPEPGAAEPLHVGKGRAAWWAAESCDFDPVGNKLLLSMFGLLPCSFSPSHIVLEATHP